MKKMLILLLSFLILVSQVSALEIKTEKTEFSQGETFFATLHGNILEPVQEEDINFYEGHVQIPLTFDMLKIEDTYYISALLPYTEKNLSIRISNVYYKEQNKVQTNDIEKNFTVSEEMADFNVEPGSFLTKSNLTLKFNNNIDEDITLSYTINESTRTTILPLQDSTELKIDILDFPSRELTFLTLSTDSGFTYNIPVYSLLDKPEDIVNQIDNRTEVNPPQDFDKLSFSIIEINETLNKGDEITRSILITNLGNKTAENVELIISFDLEDFITLSETKIGQIAPDESVEINFTAFFPHKGNFSGFILADSDNSSDKLDLNFYVSENITPTSTVSSKKTCVEMHGKKCDICEGMQEYASDGLCCLGSCYTDVVDDDGKTNWTVILIILAALGIVGAVIYVKLRKRKPNAEDILERRKKSYTERYEFKQPIEKPKSSSKE